MLTYNDAANKRISKPFLAVHETRIWHTPNEANEGDMEQDREHPVILGEYECRMTSGVIEYINFYHDFSSSSSSSSFFFFFFLK